MNHLKKFNESVRETPIDVEEDIAEFRRKFSNRKYGGIDKDLDKYMTNMISENPTMTDDWHWYEVNELDEDGRKIRKKLGIVQAIDEIHARIKISNEKNDYEIVGTGFYDAILIKNDKVYKYHLETRIKILEIELDEVKNNLKKMEIVK